MSKHIALIDGSGFIFRAFYAIPPLTRKDGVPVNAVFGFSKMLHRIMTDFDCSHMAMVFDSARANFRHEIYSEYKANRDAPPEELIPQFDLVRDATKAFNVTSIEQIGFEADDLIATLAKKAYAQGFEVTVISSDKDLMQLKNDRTHIWDPMKQKTMQEEDVIKKFGVTSDKVVDVQALMGDSSDNVPGVPGIGVKTAAMLIQEFGTLENLLDNADKIPQKKRRESLIEHRDLALLSKKLVTLDMNAPISDDLSVFERKDFIDTALAKFLKTQNFGSMINSLHLTEIAKDIEIDIIAKNPAINNDSDVGDDHDTDAEIGDVPPASLSLVRKAITDSDALDRLCTQIRHTGYVAIDLETNGLNPLIVDIVGIGLCTDGAAPSYIPMMHIGDGEMEQLSFEEVKKALMPILLDPSIKKIGHNLKFDLQILRQHGLTVHPDSIDDTMIMSYLLFAGIHGHSLDELSKRYLDHTMIAFKDIVGSGKKQKTFDQIPIDQATDYAAEDVAATLDLYKILYPKLLASKAYALYIRMEKKLLFILMDMENHGILVDSNHLQQLSTHFADQIEQLAADIYAIAETEFNIGSPKQLGEVLFDKMGLPAPKKSKTGAYSTDASVLEKLAADDIKIVELILQWRQLSKLKSTYSDALQEQINHQTGRVHTQYSLTTAITGRLSSNNPNLQNIPIRTKEGQQIRKAFIAREGYQLLSMDYSQIELRLVAHIANDPAMIDAFKHGKDIHAMTAAEILNKPLEEVTSDDRRKAKAINFGIIYGVSAFGLAKQLDIGRSDAKNYIDFYMMRFPGIKRYMEKMQQFARDHESVYTLFHRQIHLPNINSKVHMLRQFAERQAINAPIQGTAADLIKRAMIHVQKVIDNYNHTHMDKPIHLLLQVHDELIFEVPASLCSKGADQDSTLIQDLKKAMENAHHPFLDLSVPLVVDYDTGPSWFDAH